jgi:hypothetical protein
MNRRSFFAICELHFLQDRSSSGAITGMAVAPLFLRRNALRLLRPTVLRSCGLHRCSKRSAYAPLHSDARAATILWNKLDTSFL